MNMTTWERTLRSRWGWLCCMVLVMAFSQRAEGQPVVRPKPVKKGTASASAAAAACPGAPNCGIQRAYLGEIGEVETNCPTGNCDPGGTGNAKGIYTAEGGNYCFEAMGQRYFCPEAFFNMSNWVELELRILDNPKVVQRHRMRGRLVQGNAVIDVLSVLSERTQLTIQYRLRGQSQVNTATGAALGNIVLAVDGLTVQGGSASSPLSYEMRFIPISVPDADAKLDRVYRYALEYREVSSQAPWHKHCEADQGAPAVSFLENERVSGINASIKMVPKVTTMGCEQGSIVTCLAWGYTPWDPDTGNYDETRDYVFRSCLQGKRAAYFVGQGDFKSYTCVGTKIDRWDQYQFGDGTPVDRVEALWSPRGAVCFNPENRRRPNAETWKGQDPKNLNTHGVPVCTSSDFTLEGKFFSGLPGLPSLDPCPAAAAGKP